MVWVKLGETEYIAQGWDISTEPSCLSALVARTIAQTQRTAANGNQKRFTSYCKHSTCVCGWVHIRQVKAYNHVIKKISDAMFDILRSHVQMLQELKEAGHVFADDAKARTYMSNLVRDRTCAILMNLCFSILHNSVARRSMLHIQTRGKFG